MKQTVAVVLSTLCCLLVLPKLVPTLHTTNARNATQIDDNKKPSPKTFTDGNPMPPIPPSTKAWLTADGNPMPPIPPTRRVRQSFIL